MDFNATNKTPNYSLPIFIDADKPSWLVDWNGAMTELDTIIKEISTAEKANENLITKANSNITKINNIIEEIQAYNTALTNRVVTLEGKTNKLESEYNTVINDLQAQNRLVLQLQDAVNTINSELDSITNNIIPPIKGGLDSLTQIVNDNNQQTTQKLAELDSKITNITTDVIPPIEGSLGSLTNMVNKNISDIEKNSNDITQNSNDIEAVTTRVSSLENEVRPLASRSSVVHCLNESGILPETIKNLTNNYALKNISVVVYCDYTIANGPKMALAPVYISNETSVESNGTFGVETKTIITPDGTENYTVAVSYGDVGDAKTLRVSVSGGNNKVALRAYTVTAQVIK